MPNAFFPLNKSAGAEEQSSIIIHLLLSCHTGFELMAAGVRARRGAAHDTGYTGGKPLS